MGTPGQGEVPVASGNGNCSSSNSYNHTSVNTTGMGKQSVSGSTVAVVKEMTRAKAGKEFLTARLGRCTDPPDEVVERFGENKGKFSHTRETSRLSHLTMWLNIARNAQ